MQGGDHTWVWGSKVDISIILQSLPTFTFLRQSFFLTFRFDCWNTSELQGPANLLVPCSPPPQGWDYRHLLLTSLLNTSLVGRMWGSEFTPLSPVSSSLQLNNPPPSPTHPSVSALFSCCFNFVSRWVSLGRILFAKVGVTYWNMDELTVATPLEKVYFPFQQWSLSVHGFSETAERDSMLGYQSLMFFLHPLPQCSLGLREDDAHVPFRAECPKPLILKSWLFLAGATLNNVITALTSYLDSFPSPRAHWDPLPHWGPVRVSLSLSCNYSSLSSVSETSCKEEEFVL